jgi:Zn ribbon nucleic-acid-binding protein
MTVRPSGTDCPDCGSELQIIYATELEQVVSGWACGECGFIASETEQSRVDISQNEEYVLRIEKPLTSDDVSDPRDSIAEEFRRRARENASGEEVWSLVDTDDGSLVDLYAPGDEEE